jgi:probable HAF family extracellular repeat protein
MAIDVPGAAATVASDINNRGTIVGDYFDADGNDHGFIAKPAKMN